MPLVAMESSLCRDVVSAPMRRVILISPLRCHALKGLTRGQKVGYVLVGDLLSGVFLEQQLQLATTLTCYVA